MPSKHQNNLPPPAPGADTSATTAQALLQQALAWHQQGQLAQAEAGYLQVLKLQPRHFDALHYLGVAYLQAGQIEHGIESIQKAIAIDPGQPPAYLNLANALVICPEERAALEPGEEATAIMLGPVVPESAS